MALLEIKDLYSTVTSEKDEQGKDILNGVSLKIEEGEVHVLMGTNGSGKSTLAHILMGHPRHRVTSGQIFFKEKDLRKMTVDERAREGIFLAYQYPHTIAGLPVGTFLKNAVEAVRGEGVPVKTFRKELTGLMDRLQIPKEFLSRSLNEGFSGGEKKRTEILQMHLLNPSLAILDETDSGLDVDAMKMIFQDLQDVRTGKNSFLIITHYDRVLDYIEPDYVHILSNGKIVLSGGPNLSKQIEKEGFEAVIRSRA
jgi:Fe-S cluster assembly ATP-binding protein